MDRNADMLVCHQHITAQCDILDEILEIFSLLELDGNIGVGNIPDDIKEEYPKVTERLEFLGRQWDAHQEALKPFQHLL